MPHAPRYALLLLVLAVSAASLLADGSASAADRQLLWGDTHLHSNNSFDAFLNRNMSGDPATAYRYAKGQPVIHPYHRARVQIETPLDFLVVADHAELLGVMRTIIESGIPKDDLGWMDWGRSLLTERWLRGVIEDDEGASALASFLPKPMPVEEAAANPPTTSIPGSEAMSRTVWQEAIQIADEHNEPGRFTALIGWEWSAIPAGANLHRVVFTNAGADIAGKFQPYGSDQSMYPEDLLKWLDQTSSRTGADFISIPHNSNISKGYMFPEKTLRGAPFTAEYAAKRKFWESVVEATQIKGDSETHPVVSPNDPFADFETYPHYIQNDAPDYAPGPGDYVRSGLLRGLAIEARIGVNPYRFGLIGSTDAHTGLASAEEPNFWGKLARDSTPETKRTAWARKNAPTGWSMSASGLAAVWAESNTRQAIFDAFRRREVYATTGPRIQVRFHGAADGDDVPMGGELTDSKTAPTFRVEVLKDPNSANLDRVQIVKGWIDANGDTHERIVNVAWGPGESGERTRGPDGLVPPVGNTVNPDSASYTNDIGTPQLEAEWQDDEFDMGQSAFYYARVLEIPTPRHSVFDALALGEDPREIQGPWWIQERAYTSPIWYAPASPRNGSAR